MSFNSFTQRVRNHPPVAAVDAPDGTLHLAVSNQLLVAQSVSAALDLQNTYQGTLLTTLLDGINPVSEGHPEFEDVEIWHLDDLGQHENIFALVEFLRGDTPISARPGTVSPNHILIPAPVDHSCPYGAPYPVSGVRNLPVPTGGPQHVTVIDSGYGWSDANWGPNPLEGRVQPLETHRLPTVDEATNIGQQWQDRVSDAPDAKVPGSADLVALAGHANFIAGVILQLCPDAQITIRNHSGLFTGDDDFPTEATVARSLCETMSTDQSHYPAVIELGFAFTTYGGHASTAWNTTFEFIGNDVLVVVPSGNQGSEDPRYPAALGLSQANPHGLPHLIGVGSIDPAPPGGQYVRSEFSNFGEWVACSAIGRNVESTFLDYEGSLEDGDGADVLFTENAWAVWNGTSFAAPKIVGLIARSLAGGAQDVTEAWTEVQAQAGGQEHDLGYVFQV
jgi:hypothetical protein